MIKFNGIFKPYWVIVIKFYIYLHVFILISRNTFLHILNSPTESLGHSNEESEQFTGSGVRHGYIQCYRKNKENGDSKTKKNRLSKYMCYIQTEKTQNNKTLCWKWKEENISVSTIKKLQLKRTVIYYYKKKFSNQIKALDFVNCPCAKLNGHRLFRKSCFACRTSYFSYKTSVSYAILYNFLFVFLFYRATCGLARSTRKVKRYLL